MQIFVVVCKKALVVVVQVGVATCPLAAVLWFGTLCMMVLANYIGNRIELEWFRYFFFYFHLFEIFFSVLKGLLFFCGWVRYLLSNFCLIYNFQLCILLFIFSCFLFLWSKVFITHHLILSSLTILFFHHSPSYLDLKSPSYLDLKYVHCTNIFMTRLMIRKKVSMGFFFYVNYLRSK